MFDFNQDLNARAVPHAASAKIIREGRYAFRIKGIADARTTKGAQKYEVSCEVVAQADGLTDLIGTVRKQHLVVGHPKPDVASNYEAEFLCLLKACGVNLSALKNIGDLYMATKSIESANPAVVLWYDVVPQPNDPKYLNWHLVMPESAENGVAAPVYVPPAPVAAPVYVPPAPVAAPVVIPPLPSGTPATTTLDALFAV